MESKFVKIKGNYNIHYLEEGQREHTLILLHGIPVNSSVYEKLIPLLSKNFRVIAPDFIGFGNSDKPLDFDYNLRNYTDMFKAFVNALNLEKFSLAAMDLGLMVAINYAMNNPKTVKNLIMFEGFILPIETTIKNMGFSSRFALSLMKNDKISKDLIIKNGEKTISSFINSGLINKLSDPNLEKYATQFKDKNLRKKLWYEGLGFHTIKTDKILAETIKSNYEKLKKSKLPKLLLAGVPGQVVKSSTINLIKTEIPKIEIKYIGKGKHFLPLDAPENIAKEILEFLNH